MQFLMGYLVEVDQVFNQALQFDAALSHDADNFLLLPGKPTRDELRKQIGALAQGGQRRLELMGDMAQELFLLSFRVAQLLPEPRAGRGIPGSKGLPSGDPR